ncbi:anthranilate phosphoribosyltransferase family protein [Almyronema epifaneia]|uniref:Anthranilate phosphoribosyltransferase family protein n=1 Tax=Almyronema epifaneia S1 TaxID=2991925 RepID=A0ABW6IEI6_9CYAN
MSQAFRSLLQKVGSGSHTSKDLSRAEAAIATCMMLEQEATPAQLGAFMIAHRIKRPTPEELAGMLDAYDQLGPKLTAIESAYPVTVFSVPYDGRSRTLPISPLTALMLAAVKAPVVLHGGDRMPTKYGLPLIEIWQGLGVNWQQLSLAQAQQMLAETGLSFVYLPRHFPQAQAMVPYRDQIGKRPPFATIEIMWSPYAGNTHLVSGFVHPPTEERTVASLALRKRPFFTTVKGLEGSCDLARSRTAIIGLGQINGMFDRLLLSPRDYGFSTEDPPLLEEADAIAALQSVIDGKPSEVAQSAIWNGGFYLWRCGVSHTLEAGFTLAEKLVLQGQLQQKLAEVQEAIAAQVLVTS